MRTVPIRPAYIVRDGEDPPRSPAHDDLYFPRQGALAQARQVFLAGNGLPERWRGRERFVILETGFGLGNNFLATWAAWRADDERPNQLHFISIEAAPPTHADLVAQERDAALAGLATELAAAWPPLVCNLHCLLFETGAVRLSLAFGEAAAWLPQLVANVDAFYLDGFAPARNPDIWEPRLFKAMARLAAPGATLATWTAAAAVRSGLRTAGFDVHSAPGSGGKREITLGCHAPRFVPRSSGRYRTPTIQDDDPVVIVGAGLAGCAVAAALAARGRHSIILERGDAVADEGSGNEAALFHGIVHAEDGRHARFYRAAALHAGRIVAQAVGEQGIAGSVCGLLRLEPRAAQHEALRGVIERLALPADYVRACSAAEASELAGLALDTPAWFFPGGGWVAPRELAVERLRSGAGRCHLRLGAGVETLARQGDRWLLRGAAGSTLAAASTVVLANAGDALRLLGSDVGATSSWPVSRQCGELSSAPIGLWGGNAPRLPIVGAGYVCPPTKGRVWFGASVVAEGAVNEAEVHHQQQANINRLGTLLRDPPALVAAEMGSRRGLRWTAADRLPLIGAVPVTTAPGRLDQLRFIERRSGLFMCAALGSRGVISALLGAEIVAAAVTGAPAPVESDLLDAVDPARFMSRTHRRRDGAAPV